MGGNIKTVFLAFLVILGDSGIAWSGDGTADIAENDALIVAINPEEVNLRGVSLLEELLGDRDREITGDLGRIRDLIQEIGERKIVNQLLEGDYDAAYWTSKRYGLILTILPSTGSEVVLSFVPLRKTNLSVADAVTAANAYITITTGEN